MTGELSIERRDAVAWFTLNRAKELNSLSPHLLRALDLALAEMLVDPSVRTIVFTGAGRAFCAGAREDRRDYHDRQEVDRNGEG